MSVQSPIEQKLIDRLTEITEAHLTDKNFGVAELVNKSGISHSSLHRKLKVKTQQSISQFIREIRLKRAKDLLEHQAGTASEVAYGVGFASTTYFSKCFHDYYGYPPGKVRKPLAGSPGHYG